MAVYRARSRQRLTLVVVILLSTTIIMVGQRGTASRLIDGARGRGHDLVASVKSMVDGVVSPVADVVGGIVHYGELRTENARLRQQLADQRGEVERARNLEREHRELLDLQGLPFVGDIPSVTAQVVSTSPTNFELTLGINKGSADGVAKGMPVVCGQGLVGHVAEVSRGRAVVLLVIDPDSNVGVKMASSGDLGVARGRGSGQSLMVDFIDPGTKVSPGETVVTSGVQGSPYPPGIPVGKVRTADPRPGALQQAVTMDPVPDLQRASFLRVLQWSPT